jgi:hypothetical protein
MNGPALLAVRAALVEEGRFPPPARLRQ